MKELQLATKTCCIPACQALPLSRLFLRSQGNCLSSLSQRHFGLFTRRAPVTRDSNFGNYTPNFLWNSRVLRAGAVQETGVKEVAWVRGFSGREPGDCEGWRERGGGRSCGLAPWLGSKSNLLLLSLGAPQKLVSGG